MAHIPVLLKEVIEFLSSNEGDTVFDGTLGGGGHSKALCEKIGKKGTIIGTDQDSAALERARVALRSCESNIILRQDNFRNIARILDELGISQIDRALFDLGMSSDQLESSGRGFSFMKDEPLLMTFNPAPTEADITAHEIVNKWAEESIADIIYGYGEERFARRIARRIVEERSAHPIETTADLVEIVKKSVPVWYRSGRKTHCATKTFQALRIATNDELRSAREGIVGALSKMSKGGRVAVITFHSIEDRMAKTLLREKEREGVCKVITKKPIAPSEEEVRENPRARSAKLRVCEKL